MSAFVVEPETIQMIIGYAASPSNKDFIFPNYMLCEDLDNLCSDLLNENIKSVNYRYREDSETEFIKYDSKWSYSKLQSNATIMKAIKYYQYQACEHPGWDNSKAKEITDKIYEHALYNFLSSNKEYKEALDPWLLQVK